jgi:hypothetical protein
VSSCLHSRHDERVRFYFERASFKRPLKRGREATELQGGAVSLRGPVEDRAVKTRERRLEFCNPVQILRGICDP